VLDHKGEHFSVRGPLNVPRPPQGHPVIVQAGSSDVGKELAAEIAEVVFTAHQTLENAKKFYDDLKGRLAKYGRTADDIKVMPGVSPVIGRTQDEADEKFAKLQSLVHPEIGLALLGELLGNIDLSPYPLDGPLPEIVKSDSSQHVLKMFTDMAKNEQLTIRELYLRIVVRGHWIIRGTPQTIADHLEDWFRNGGCDGYNVMPPYLPAAARGIPQGIRGQDAAREPRPAAA
jgi:N-acetyl-S-(2-succino)cysteine monooxygenase